MYRNVLHGVMKNVNVNTLENVKRIQSKSSHINLVAMLLYLTFKKIPENFENRNSLVRWGHTHRGRHIHEMDDDDGPAASPSIVLSRNLTLA